MDTDQEKFSYVVIFMLKQNQQCKIGDQCVLRAGELRCAVGCLIPDDVDLADYRSLNPHLFTILQLSFRLQQIHDGHPPSEWLDLFTQAAKDFGLTMPVGLGPLASPKP